MSKNTFTKSWDWTLKGPGLLAAVVTLTCALSSSQALAISYSLGAAADFAGLQLGGGVFTISSGNTVVNGNIGEGSSGSLNFSGGGHVNGTIYANPGASVVLSGGSVASGGTVYEPMSAIVTAALNAASTFGSLPGASLPNITSSETLSGNGGLNVYSVSKVNLQGGSTLTLQGGANDLFVFKVGSGGFTMGGGSSILLDGVTPDHILFDIVNSAVNLNGNSKTYGTFLDVNGNITVSGGTHIGEFISGGSLKFQSGPQVTQSGYSGGGSVPEGGITISMLGMAMGGLVLLRKR